MEQKELIYLCNNSCAAKASIKRSKNKNSNGEKFDRVLIKIYGKSVTAKSSLSGLTNVENSCYKKSDDAKTDDVWCRGEKKIWLKSYVN